jgi:hypothetical protein
MGGKIGVEVVPTASGPSNSSPEGGDDAPQPGSLQKRIETATAKVFGKRPYTSLTAFEKLRVDLAAVLEIRAVEYAIIYVVILYSIIIFFSLAIDSNDCNTETVTWQEWVNGVLITYLDTIFLSLFMLELSVKTFAYGHKYFSSGVTVFDACIVVASFAFNIFELTVSARRRVGGGCAWSPACA